MRRECDGAGRWRSSVRTWAWAVLAGTSPPAARTR